jgi:hypothetical protein
MAAQRARLGAAACSAGQDYVRVAIVIAIADSRLARHRANCNGRTCYLFESWLFERVPVLAFGSFAPKRESKDYTNSQSKCLHVHPPSLLSLHLFKSLRWLRRRGVRVSSIAFDNKLLEQIDFNVLYIAPSSVALRKRGVTTTRDFLPTKP